MINRSLAYILISFLFTSNALAQFARIVQTNSKDDVIHLIDPETQTIVDEIKGIPVNHGVAAAPDGSKLYFSSEAKQTLDVVDTNTLQITKEIPLSGRPNNISISKNGRYVYVGIMQVAGGIDIVDTTTMENVRNIKTDSMVHNTFVTPDGKYLVAGTFGGKGNLDVYSTETEQRVFQLYPPRTDESLEGVRPIAFDTYPDGSTKNMYVQISFFHGFTVVDFNARKEIARIELPSIPKEQHASPPFNGAPTHGIGVTPDQRSLWVCSRLNGYVYAYSLPDLEYLGAVKAGSHPDWITFSPDGRFAYAANGHSDDVSIIDTREMKEVVRLKTGKSPKRNIAAILPR